MTDEQKFLHDISSPFTSIHLNLENAISILGEGGTEENMRDALALLQKSLERVQQSMRMVQERRAALQKATQP